MRLRKGNSCHHNEQARDGINAKQNASDLIDAYIWTSRHTTSLGKVKLRVSCQFEVFYDDLPDGSKDTGGSPASRNEDNSRASRTADRVQIGWEVR